MKIVIELDDKVYGLLKRTERVFKYIDKEDDTVDTALMRAVINGTPLPKGHGDLIDRDELLIEAEWYGERATYSNPIPNGETAVPEEVVLNAPTIIEGSENE